MAMINFQTNLFRIGSWVILKLPKQASAELPSRGMVMVKGTINDAPLQVALEPDGIGSHWFRVDDTLLKAANANIGDTVELSIESTKEWPEPELPEDLEKALAADPKARKLWLAITPMARWDWIRWIRATLQESTRARRIEVAFSKLKASTKRPCCFNRSMSTVASVSKNGVLMGPTEEDQK